MEILKIGKIVETVGQNKIVRKSFQRGLQTVETTSAYAKDKLYFRKWTVQDFNGTKVLKQSYINGQPVKGSQSINFFA